MNGQKGKESQKVGRVLDSKVEGSEVAQADMEIHMLQRPPMMCVILACSFRKPPR